MIAAIDCMRIMATDAVEVAPLQKNDQTVAWPINARKRQDATHQRLLVVFHSDRALIKGRLHFHANHPWFSGENSRFLSRFCPQERRVLT